MTFLNLVVQKIIPETIQDFIRAWLRQECKDFRIVFIQKKDASDEEKQAITYACGFASVIGYSSLVVAVTSEDEVPKAKMTKFLKDTSILPVDRMEVMHLEASASRQRMNESHLKQKSNHSDEKQTSIQPSEIQIQRKYQYSRLQNYYQPKISKETAEQQRNQKKLLRSNPILQVEDHLQKNKSKSNPYQEDDVTVAMATQPCRWKSALNVIFELLPQCTRFCICLNGFDRIPNDLPKSPKIIAVLANGNGNNPPDLGCDNKMYWLGDFPGYYATVDDDIIYPSNYIRELKAGIDRYSKKAIVSFHGHKYITSGRILTKDRTLLWYKNKHSTEYCHRLGMGVAMTYPSAIGLTKDVFLKHPKNTGDDELMAIWAQKHSVPMICLSTYNIDIASNDVAAMKNPLSSGNNTIQKRKNLLENYTRWTINEIKSKHDLTIAMATQPHRCQQMLNVVKMLLPFCTRFCIALNCYDQVPEELKALASQSKKITTILTGKDRNIVDLGNLNKMYWLGDFPGYYATVDDDLAYSKRYIETLIYYMKLFGDKAICAYHGLLFTITNGIVDLSSKKIIFYNKENDQCQACLRPGMGTAMMNPQNIGISKDIYLSQQKGYSDDIITSIFAQQHDIPCMVVKHGANDVLATDFAFSGLFRNVEIQKIRTSQMLAYKNWKYNWG